MSSRNSAWSRRIAGAETVPAAPSIVRVTTGDWGYFPALALLAAVGLLIVGFGYSGARTNTPWSDTVFAIGLVTIFFPIAARLITHGPAREERIALIAYLALVLYLVKVMRSPLGLTFSDEFAHWRTALDIVQSGHLFTPNPLLPISSLYPGLEIASAALVSVTGLSYFSVALIMLGIARLLLVLALYLFYEQISRSERLAAMATLLYMANPNFLFFGAQYAYETLALAFTVLVYYAAACRVPERAAERRALTCLIIFGQATAVVIHHVTSYAFITFYLLWEFVGWWRRRSQPTPAPNGMILFGIVASSAWLACVASVTVGYLAPHLWGGVVELMNMMAGETTGRQLFRAYSGVVAPLWERVASAASVLLVLGGLPIALFVTFRKYRMNSLALTLAVATLAYPVSLALRLTTLGAETSNRASEFVFFALAFVLAIGIVEFTQGRPVRKRVIVAFACWSSAIFLGGVFIGWAPWARLPGPYSAAADARSVEPQGIAAASWAYDELGPGNRMIADRTNRLLMGTFGEQRPVTSYGDKVQTAYVFFSPNVGTRERTLLKRGQIEYIVADHRLSEYLPLLGAFFERGEPDTFRHTKPLDPAFIEKFDDVPKVSRIFDSGDIRIYDVAALK